MTCVYLMTHLGITFDAALRHVVECRPCACPNDGFKRQINEFERTVRDELMAKIHTDSPYVVLSGWIEGVNSAQSILMPIDRTAIALLQRDLEFIHATKPSTDIDEKQNKVSWAV